MKLRLMMSPIAIGLCLISCGGTSFSGGTNNPQVAAPKPAPVPVSANVQVARPIQPMPSPVVSSPVSETAGTIVNTPTPVSTGPADVVPPNATTVGSFTVWTVPPNPAAFQSYNIVIRVALPSTITNLNPGDLSGSVHGTDSYVQYFGPSDPASIANFEVQPGFAQAAIWVPGGAQSVHDTIVVSSATLNQTQTIGLVFGGYGPF